MCFTHEFNRINDLSRLVCSFYFITQGFFIYSVVCFRQFNHCTINIGVFPVVVCNNLFQKSYNIQTARSISICEMPLIFLKIVFYMR